MRNLFFFLGLMLFVLACQKEGGGEYTPSGTRYTLHTNVDGPKPQPGEWVYFHAQIRNGDSVYYASRTMRTGEPPFFQIPLDPPADRQVPPYEEVLLMMSVGDSATFEYRLDTLPPDQKPAGFENADIMYQDLVSVDIKTAEEYQELLVQQRAEAAAKREAAQERFGEVQKMAAEIAENYRSKKLDGELKSTESGLKYMILEEGEGRQAEAGNVVSVQYYGMLTDGKMFDSSFQRGEAYPFRLGLGEVIRGWDEGIALLKEGSKGVLFIPAELGYGERGSGAAIPPNSELIFYVELESVK